MYIIKRMSNFPTCILTCKTYGESIFEEVLGIV